MEDYSQAKERLIQELKTQGISKKVLQAIREVERHLFVGKDQRSPRLAYANRPLPIGQGQTISQPYTVAFMIQLLDLEKGQKILEVGAGSGYNAAVMAQLIGSSGKIYSVEIVKPLIELARENLKKANIENIKIIHTNGYKGYKPAAPYNRIIVTAASPDIPEPLVEQLKVGGIMVIPVKEGWGETMKKIVKQENGDLKTTNHGGFRFVPLVNREPEKM